MKVKSLVRNFSNLSKLTQIELIRDGFNKTLTLEQALKCKQKVKFFSYYSEVCRVEGGDPYPELIIEIE